MNKTAQGEIQTKKTALVSQATRSMARPAGGTPKRTVGPVEEMESCREKLKHFDNQLADLNAKITAAINKSDFTKVSKLKRIRAATVSDKLKTQSRATELKPAVRKLKLINAVKEDSEGEHRQLMRQQTRLLISIDESLKSLLEQFK